MSKTFERILRELATAGVRVTVERADDVLTVNAEDTRCSPPRVEQYVIGATARRADRERAIVQFASAVSGIEVTLGESGCRKGVFRAPSPDELGIAAGEFATRRIQVRVVERMGVPVELTATDPANGGWRVTPIWQRQITDAAIRMTNLLCASDPTPQDIAVRVDCGTSQQERS